MIVDAVGVMKTVKTASRPLDTKPSVPFRDLAMGVVMGVRDDDSPTGCSQAPAALTVCLPLACRRSVEWT